MTATYETTPKVNAKPATSRADDPSLLSATDNAHTSRPEPGPASQSIRGPERDFIRVPNLGKPPRDKKPDDDKRRLKKDKPKASQPTTEDDAADKPETQTPVSEGPLQPPTSAGGIPSPVQPVDSATSFLHFSRSSATQIARSMRTLGPSLASQFTKDRDNVVAHAPAISVVIDSPANLAPIAARAEVALPSADAVELEAIDESDAAIPEAEARVPDQPNDNQVSTSAGSPPKYQVGKADNPGRMDGVRAQAGNVGAAAQRSVAEAIVSDPSAMRIQPIAVDRSEKISLAESTTPLETSATQEMEEYQVAEVPTNVRVQADNDFSSLLEASLAEPRSSVSAAASQRDTDIDASFAQGQLEADQASIDARAEQEQAVSAGREQVELEKQKYLKESESKLAEFDNDVTALDQQKRGEIDSEIKGKTAEAEKAITEAELEAERVKQQAEKDEAAAEAEKESKKERKKKWYNLVWEWVTYIPRKAIEAFTKAVTWIYTEAKKAVSKVLQAAKDIAVGVIRALKTAVIGMIKAFASGLKLLVSGLLVFFPELRSRANAAIDSAVDTAVQLVEAIANKLEEKVVALIDQVGGWVTKALEIFEAAVTTALAVAQSLLSGDFRQAALILFLAACKTLGIPGEELLQILQDAGSALSDIIKRPAGFLKNLLASVKLGFGTFATNFRERFISGLTGWLFGNLATAGIELPKNMNLKSIFMFLIQVIGFTAEYIRGKVVAMVGPENVERIQQVMEFVQRMFSEGPGFVWQWIQDKAGEIKQKIIEAASEWLITQLVTKAIIQLATMFTPVGAFVQAILMMYNTIMFFVERIKQIFELVKSITSSFKTIAQGAIQAAAGWIDQTLTRTIPLIIAFLARLVGLSGIGDQIRSVVNNLRAPIDKAITYIVEMLIKLAKKAWGAIKGGATRLKAKAMNWWNAVAHFKTGDGIDHELSFEGTGKNARLMVASSKKEPVQDKQAKLKSKGIGSESTHDNVEKAAKNVDQTIAATPIQNQTEGQVANVEQSQEALADELQHYPSLDEDCRIDGLPLDPNDPDYAKKKLEQDWLEWQRSNQPQIGPARPWEAEQDAEQDIGTQIRDIVTDFVPGVSNVKDSIIAVTGANPVTEEQVSMFGRVLAGIFAIPGIGNLAKGGKAIWKGLHWIGDQIGKLGPLLSRAKDAVVALGGDGVKWTLEKGFELWKAIQERLGKRSTASNRLPWDNWQNLPKVVQNGKEYAKIGERLYTRHAVDRMLPSGLGRPAGGDGPGRSIPPAFVEATIQNGTQSHVIVDGVQRTVHTSGTVQIVTEQRGRIVVTVNPFSGR